MCGYPRSIPSEAGRAHTIFPVEVPNGARPEDLENLSRRMQDSLGQKPMINISAGAAATILSAAMCAGCATESTFSPFSARGSEKVVPHAADVFIHGVNYTRASSREVAGWCWNEKATEKLAYVAQAGVGEYEGVGVALPTDPRGTRYVSCSWHTHPWGSHAAPGPSNKDLLNSTHPWVIGITHFVLDEHGIWQYSKGRVLEMCPWNSARTNFDPTRCRSGFQGPTNTYSRVIRFYGRRD